MAQLAQGVWRELYPTACLAGQAKDVLLLRDAIENAR